jgi:small subunit ribosomal protein S17e
MFLQVVDEVAVTPSKRMRNKIGGYVTHLMRRLGRGDNVRGISLKLQEEERERRMDYVPERSALDRDQIDIDSDTASLLKHLKVNLPNVVVPDRSRGRRNNNNDNRQGGGGGGGGGGGYRGKKPEKAE